MMVIRPQAHHSEFHTHDRNSDTLPNRLRRFLSRYRRAAAVLAAIAVFSFPPGESFAEQDASALAKAAQNPVADLVSVPLQLNMNFDTGPQDDLLVVLNVQPVVPVGLSENWNLITRTIVPLISQPDFGVYEQRENGIGDIQFSAFLSPKAPTRGGWIWGAGAVTQLDTATDDRLGQGVWGMGPTAVALKIAGPWVIGALANNIWSVDEDNSRGEVNQFLAQPFVNYNFLTSPGRYLSFSPIITADWEAQSGEEWTVPVGLGIGQITRLGKQPVNLQAAYYYNVVAPDGAPGWQLRLQMQLMFPK